MNIYQKDSNNKDILLSFNKQQVMMEWEKSYMIASIDTLYPKGDVLEIGFGLGYSATQIMTYNPKSYTIIECDSVVIERIKKWAKSYPNIPITIIEGKWQKKLHALGIFDQIYFDDYPIEITKKSKNSDRMFSKKRLHTFIDLCIQNHTHVGSKLSFYMNGNSLEMILSSDTMPFVKITTQTMDIFIPENCEYRNTKEQKCTIPLVEKIKEYDFDYANQKALESIIKLQSKDTLIS